jgi:hypothetical protein
MRRQHTLLIISFVVSIVLTSSIAFLLLTKNLTYSSEEPPSSTSELMNELNTGASSPHRFYPLEIIIIFSLLFLIGFWLLFYVVIDKTSIKKE